MARKRTSPTLVVRITEENWKNAIESKSGGCLIADAIKSQYPNLSGVTVDMATVRATDQAKGERYTWLTTPPAQHALLSFDQGWPKAVDSLTFKRAVKITPVTASAKQTARRRARRAELEAKVAEGEKLTAGEASALARLRKTPDRPGTTGPAEVEIPSNQTAPVVRGGRPIPTSSHPNLLAGRDRHFGAKLADPGKVFHDAVEAAVAERLAQVGK